MQKNQIIENKQTKKIFNELNKKETEKLDSSLFFDS